MPGFSGESQCYALHCKEELLLLLLLLCLYYYLFERHININLHLNTVTYHLAYTVNDNKL